MRRIWPSRRRAARCAGLTDRDKACCRDRRHKFGHGLRRWQVVIDHGRLRRVVEDIVNLVDLGDLGELRDEQRTVVEGNAVRPIQAGRQHLDLALALLVGDRIDLVDKAAADEHRALVALRQRARVRHAGSIDLDGKPGSTLS
jgi:hypothetical protein